MVRKAAALILAFAVGMVVSSPPASAQQPARVARVGFVMTGPPEVALARAVLDAFRRGLRERGYVEGQNIALELRYGEYKLDRLPRLVAELVRLKVDLIVVGSTPVARAAKQVTSTVPIVVGAMGDPVGDGLVASLARPGGNITGLTFLGPELVAKRLQLLKEAVPDVSRVAVLWDPDAYPELTMRAMLNEAEAAARALGVQLRLMGVRGSNDFAGAFSAMTREGADALITFPSPMLFGEHRRIVDLATKSRLPAMYQSREFVEAGGLMSYGADIVDLFRRAATYVDKILKGARPADLPVEQPTNFELVINLKTAKALGLTIPQAVLIRASEVIQ